MEATHGRKFPDLTDLISLLLVMLATQSWVVLDPLDHKFFVYDRGGDLNVVPQWLRHALLQAQKK